MIYVVVNAFLLAVLVVSSGYHLYQAYKYLAAKEPVCYREARMELISLSVMLSALLGVIAIEPLIRLIVLVV